MLLRDHTAFAISNPPHLNHSSLDTTQSGRGAQAPPAAQLIVKTWPVPKTSPQKMLTQRLYSSAARPIDPLPG